MNVTITLGCATFAIGILEMLIDDMLAEAAKKPLGQDGERLVKFYMDRVAELRGAIVTAQEQTA